MAKTSVLQRPKVDTNTGRHDFDRSYVSNFNQSHGELRCVFLEPCIAGTKGVINARRFTRTAKVVFPAFQQVDQHIEFFKVPLRYLWSKWNDWKLNINDLNSSALVDWSGSQGQADLSMQFQVPRLNLGVQSSQGFLLRSGAQGGSVYTHYTTDIIKMVDDMNFGLANLTAAQGSFMINLFGLAAYQKVYFDHFRNSTYESNNPYAYNLDWLQNVPSSAPNVLEPTDGLQQSAVTRSLFRIRYKNYRNDYYHNIYPSLNYSQSQPTGQDWTLPNNLQGVSNLVDPGQIDFLWPKVSNSNSYVLGTRLLNDPENSVRYADSGVNNDGTLTNTGLNYTLSPQSINVQQIRAMFALDKLMRASAYAPKHVREQFAARYGVTLSDKVSFESERIGSLKNDIVFGEVTATSDTYNSAAGTGQQLGAIGGKGIGASDYGQDLHFYCEEDSIIIGIQYFLARANYDNWGVDEWFTKLTRNDFFIREYEHLGLRPLYRKYVALTGDPNVDNSILGFQEANMRYKVGIDRNHGLFNVDYLKTGSTGAVTPAQSELSAFTVHTNLTRFMRTSQNGVSEDYFKAHPEDLNYLFESNYDYFDQATDQFYGQVRFKFFVNAPMDVHSQPFL